jgi:hypothetical protein
MLVKGKTNRGRANEARAMRGDRRNLNRAFNNQRSHYLASKTYTGQQLSIVLPFRQTPGNDRRYVTE